VQAILLTLDVYVAVIFLFGAAAWVSMPRGDKNNQMRLKRRHIPSQ
jgi:hypothetical protein